MFDFFDEDFPLSKKQEEEYLKQLGEGVEDVEEDAREDVKQAMEIPDAEAAKEESSEEASYEDAEDIVVEKPQIDLSDIVIDEPDESITDPDDGYEDYVEEDAAEPVIKDPEETKAVESVENTDFGKQNETESLQEEVGEEALNETAAEAASEDAAKTEIEEKLASFDEIEAHLHEELRSLGEKLDNMERAVDGMDDGEISEGFSYEYDERYFAEDETPAYRHPELYKSKEASKAPTAAPKKTSAKESTVRLDSLIKAGAAIAAAAVAVKLLSGGEKKK